MNKVAAIVVCAGLIVVGNAFSFVSQPVSAGKGNGTDAKITTIEKAYDAIDCISQLKNSISSSSNSSSDSAKITTLSTSTDNNENKTTDSELVYKSGTTTEFTTLSMNSSSSSNSSGNSSDAKMSCKFNRTLTAYYTENAAYYTVDYQMSLSSDSTYESGSGSNQTKTTTSIKESANTNYELYIGKEQMLMRINKFDVVYSYDYKYTDYSNSSNNKSESKSYDDDKTITALKKTVGKWLDLTNYSEVTSLFDEINDYNIDLLTSMGTVLSEQIKDENSNLLTKNGSVYTLTDAGIAKVLGSTITSSDKGFSGKITLDLTSSTRPVMICDYSLIQTNKGSSSTSTSSGSGTYSYNISCYDELSLENVNNTVININAVETTDLEQLIKDLEASDLKEIVDEIGTADVKELIDEMKGV